jgi:uncharacterized protein (DUF305 family)
MSMTDRSPAATVNGDSSGPAKRAPWRPAPAWLGVMLVLGLALGLVIGLLAPGMRLPADDSAEAGFARDMSTHHAQAVEMSMIAHERASDSAVRLFALDIGLTQQAQKGMMQAWLRDWKLSPNTSRQPMSWMPNSAGSLQNGLMPGMATPEEMAALRAASGKAVDVAFLTMMRKHHLGGIHMAEEVVKLTDDADVTWLADSMLTGQQKELGVIDALLKDLGTGA